MTARAETAERRARIYRRLGARNRVVTALRVLVPAVGVVALGLIAAQMGVAALQKQYGFSNIRVERGAVVVDAPRYAGSFANGGTYLVTAETARAGVESFDTIELKNALLNFERADGVRMSAQAASAVLETGPRRLKIAGTTEVSDSAGAHGTLVDTIVDWPKRQLTARGPVHLVTGSERTIDARSLDFDAATRVWTFHEVTVTIPELPGGKT